MRKWHPDELLLLLITIAATSLIVGIAVAVVIDAWRCGL